MAAETRTERRRWLPRLLGGLAGLALVAVVGLALYLRLPWTRIETVRIPSGDATLAGTLLLPRDATPPYPAVVLVHGSGSQPGWAYWALYGRALVKSGMAVLAYDKRGTGDSTGTNPQALVGIPRLADIGNPKARPMRVNVDGCSPMIDILARDADAAYDWLRHRGDVDPARVGMLGVSQAGWVMPVAATRADGVAFLVVVSGPPMSCGLQVRYTEWTGALPGFADLGLSDAELDQRLQADQGPAGFDPLPVLEHLPVPTLWLMGERDHVVPTPWSARAVAHLIVDWGAPFDLRIYPDGGHGLVGIDFERDLVDWLGGLGILGETG